MTANVNKEFAKVLKQLERLGLILLSDASFPNVRRLISGGGTVGSWWADAEAQTIFAVNQMLEDHPDVLVMKLLFGKVTFIHRELWGHVYSIGVARDEWQLDRLSANAKSLLEKLDREGTVQTQKLGRLFGPKPGETAKELELRLLIHAEQVHTKSGTHAKVLETWPSWAARVGYGARPKNSQAARRFLEERVASVKKSNSTPRFPWPAELK
jgi:hypothetical protein